MPRKSNTKQPKTELIDNNEPIIIGQNPEAVTAVSSPYCYIPLEALVSMGVSFGSILCYGLILRAIHYGYRQCNNAYLSDILKVSTRTITSYVSELEEKKAIKITMINQYERKIVPLVYPEFVLDSRGDIPFVSDDANVYIKNVMKWKKPSNQKKIAKHKTTKKKVKDPIQMSIDEILNAANGGFDEL